MQSERPLDDLLRTIRAMPLSERLKLIQRLVQDVAQDAERAQGTAAHSAVIGLFADEPELVDEICEAAMAARERDPLRQPGA